MARIMLIVLLFMAILPHYMIKNTIIHGKDYIRLLLISIDQLGAAIIDVTEDWTISSNSYRKCIFEKKCLRKELIDFAFGKGHCRKSYYNEIREFNEKAKNGK